MKKEPFGVTDARGLAVEPERVAAIVTVTRTEEIPLLSGGDETIGIMIDRMISEGGVSKLSINLDKDSF